jgi:glutathione S-transferase
MLWLLEELGLPYEIKRYERAAQTMLAPASLRVTWTTWNRSLPSSAGSRAMSSARPMDFLGRIHARPAYQRALEGGGKYDLLG